MNGRVRPMADDHLGDRAELYALGTLDATEADRVNTHAARCADCAKLVGAAERAVMGLVDASVQHVDVPPELGRRIAAIDRVVPFRRPMVPTVRTATRWSALAASVVIVLGGAAVGTRDVMHMHETIAADDAALAAVANSHFKHATLTKIDPSAPTAKVLWGLSNAWIYVIVDSSTCACRVEVATDNGVRDLGVPLGHGSTASIFANTLRHVRRIEIRRDGRTIESTTLR